MAGMGPAPKAASQRRRRNLPVGARVLKAEIVPSQPPVLPDAGRDLHPLTLAFWRDIWSSPMASEWDQSDIHGLLLLADLTNEYWNLEPGTKGTVRAQLAAEIRLQRQSFGLSPIDRRRLAWEIERAEQAVDAGEKRRAARNASLPDPRLDHPLNS